MPIEAELRPVDLLMNNVTSRLRLRRMHIDGESPCPVWKVLVIGGGAAVGKTTVARELAVRYRVSVLPIDAIWISLKAATDPASSPELHYFDPPQEEVLKRTPEYLRDLHIKSARSISETLDPVIEYLLWEQSPVILEGAWITPAVAARWTKQYESVRAVFIHEPDVDEVLAAMLARSGERNATPRKRVISKVCWLFGNWVREQALANGLPVVNVHPRDTLTERVLKAVSC